MNNEYLEEALECIKSLDNMEFSRSIETYVPLIDSDISETQYLCNTDEFYIIKQALLKAQKQEKEIAKYQKMLDIFNKHFIIELEEKAIDGVVWGRLVSIQAREDEGDWDTTACANLVDFEEDYELLKNLKQEIEEDE